MTTATQLALVGDDVPVMPRPRGKRQRNGSRDARRTELQLATLERGFHPLGNALGYRIQLHRDAAPTDDRKAAGLRCGDCRFRVVLGWHARSYPKCIVGYTELDPSKKFPGDPPRMSHGGGTDVRKWWPACPDFEWGDHVSDDAARWVPGGDR